MPDAVLDHVAVAVPSIAAALPLYQESLGGRFADGGDNPAVGFRWLQLAYGAGLRLELLEALPGSRFLDSFFRQRPMGGLHHVTYLTPDLDRALAGLRASGLAPFGVNTVDETWREAFLHPKQTGGVLIQLAEGMPTVPGPTGVTDVLLGRGHHGTGIPSP